MHVRMTDRVRAALRLARLAAEAERRERFGAAHLLVGLIEVGYGVQVRALEQLSGSAEGVARLCERAKAACEGPAAGRPGLPAVPDDAARAALEQAFRECAPLGDNFVDAEHVLLALARAADSKAAQLLADVGATPEVLQSLVIAVRREPARGG